MAYAAIISLRQALENIRCGHGILHNKQQIESLFEKVSFLHDFTQQSSTQLKDFEKLIRDAAFATEDVIDYHLSNQILSDCECCVDRSFKFFCQELEQAVDRIGAIQSQIMEVSDNCFKNSQPGTLFSAGSLRSNFGNNNNSRMVGFVDELVELKDRSSSDKLEIFSVVGMGGSGKTTLAQNIYNDEFIKYHFYIRAWVTVSQQYDKREILLSLLQSTTNFTRKNCEESSTDQLEDRLYKSLKGTRYLIVLDDIWDVVNVWFDLRLLFPDDGNRSRILLTTRILDVAMSEISNNAPYQMRFLNKDESWNLLQEKVFGENEHCPCELERIGIEIAQGCGGLPLAVVLVGGLLTKVCRSKYEWSNVVINLKEIMSSQNDQCLEILSWSYNHMPNHLKTCFLYMAAFPEDYRIPVSKLILLWSAEGFLEPDSGGESVEDCGYKYLKDLINRNLVLVGKKKYSKIVTCSVHDLVRDLCLREAEKGKFVRVLMKDFDTDGSHAHRRLSIHSKLFYTDSSYQKDRFISVCELSDGRMKRIYDLMRLNPRIRVLLFTGTFSSLIHVFLGFRLLRILDASGLTFPWFPVDVVELVFLKYLAFNFHGQLPASISSLQKLEILIVNQPPFGPHMHQPPSYLPCEIWSMPMLRHLELSDIFFPDFPDALFYGTYTFSLENLLSMSRIRNLKLTEDVVKSIPNVKKLGIVYNRESEIAADMSFYCLRNLVCLNQLETLKCEFHAKRHARSSPKQSLPDLSFPLKLKKLTLCGWVINGKDLMVIGSLGSLEVMKLKFCDFEGPAWELLEGEFCRLKLLLLDNVANLVNWTAETNCLPNLEFLVIRQCEMQIPSSFGDIPTLQSIYLYHCSRSCVTSAKQILEDQQSFGNDDLEVHDY